MIDMAEKKRGPKKPQAAQKPERGAQLGVAIDPVIRDQMNKYIESYNASHDHRATLTSTVEAALKKYLAEQGFWPPKKEPEAT